MAKLNYYIREAQPYGRLAADERWEDVLVAGVAIAWTLAVLIGLVARFSGADARPDRGDALSRAEYDVQLASWTTGTLLLLVGGAAGVAIAAGVAHRVNASPRGWDVGWGATVLACAAVGAAGFLYAAVELFA